MSEQKGGRRILEVSPQFLVAVMKRHDGMGRTLMVSDSLPDDTQIVDGRVAWNREGCVEIVLESAEWQDSSVDRIERLMPPCVTVHYREPRPQ